LPAFSGNVPGFPHDVGIASEHPPDILTFFAILKVLPLKRIEECRSAGKVFQQFE
jgi:hypothetical protein